MCKVPPFSFLLLLELCDVSGSDSNSAPMVAGGTAPYERMDKRIRLCI